MQSQFNVTSYLPPGPPKSAETVNLELTDLVRQMLEVQRDQLTHMKQAAAAQDAGAKWRALMARWSEEFPDLPAGCKETLPVLEKAFGAMLSQLVEELRDQGPDALDNDFALQDFLDRYGMRLGQMGNILNLVGPLAEAGAQNESPEKPS